MDSHIKEYYKQYSDGAQNAHFHRVIPLHDSPDIDWSEISKKVPKLCKGWFELAHLSTADRIDFTREFWLSKLPYHPRITGFLESFFASLDDIGIFVIQNKFDDPYEVHMVYSLSNNSGFFHGSPPAHEEDIIELEKAFPAFILPSDYIAFFKIHNGFSKLTDTGITPTFQMIENFKKFQSFFADNSPPTTTQGAIINPTSLIPFYESFGMPFYQCFWGEWYPDQEMGNVYYSGVANTISDSKSEDSSFESLAFPTFIDWLIFYLEKIE